MLGLSGVSTCQCCCLAVTPGKTTVKHDNIFWYCVKIPFSSLLFYKVKFEYDIDYDNKKQNQSNQTKPITEAQTRPFWSH